MNLPFIDRIWRVKGTLALDGPQAPASVFDKLAPLFQTNGTSYRVDQDTLTYSNKNPAPQDKLATFNSGTLRVVEEEGRSKLVYNLKSPALLFCFLAPLLFLGFGQFIVALGEFEKPATEAADKAKKSEKKDAEVPMNPIDKFLGAPAPEKPKKDGADKGKDHDKKRSPTPAYVFAAIFAVLYLVGRILEPWLIKSVFRKRLSDASPLPGREAPFAK